MDKKQVYCRYCGKHIDEDAHFVLTVASHKEKLDKASLV